VLIPREGGGEARPGALTSTSNGTIRFISAMARYYSKKTWRTSDALGLQRASTFYKATFRPVVKLGGGRERHRAPLALPAAGAKRASYTRPCVDSVVVEEEFTNTVILEHSM
jgi:hypothetical protein